jgi:threonylcarbamoyladenosine tRNA methylthiotransferase MtaB
LNQYDTESLRTLLEKVGSWRTVPFREDADVYVVNTCSVTSRADATARKAIRRIHAEHPQAAIVVTGCYAQRAPTEIAELPGVNLILGAADRGDVAEHLNTLEDGETRMAVSPISAATKFLDVPITEMMEHSRAFVKIQEGCNESCTFCIVPQTRGRSRSRSVSSVVAQVEQLVAAGYYEIVLTGVHAGEYGLDRPPGEAQLVPLMRRLLEISGLQRLRLSSIEPSTISAEIIELVATERRVARHFHIPFQSGSNEVLARMQRRYRVEDFMALVSRIEASIPECGIGTDVICGFPGESDEQFAETFDCLTQLPVTYLHPFTYSVRPGSTAESFGDSVNGDIKKRRVRALKKLSADKNAAFRERHVGREMEVLLETSRRNGSNQVSGWTDNYLRVELGPRNYVPSGLERVRINGMTDAGLAGEPLLVDVPFIGSV